jgi:hypothetical protein
MSRWLLALLFAVAAAPLASARDALTAIDACIARLDAALDVGYARIRQRCPDLPPSLAGSAVAPWLPPDWNKPNNELSAAGLKELRTLLTRPTPTAAVRAPRVARLGAVLAGLAASASQQRGWWARFKQWLREILEWQQAEDHSPWWRRWFASLNLPQRVLDLVAAGALAVVTALVLAVLANEMRVAGVTLGRRSRAAPSVRGRAAARAERSLDDLERAGPAEQPRLLLELVVARLREQDRLPPARALTLHELTRAARLAAPDRARLGVLTATCERLRFAAQAPPPPALAAALAGGRELLGTLVAPALAGEGQG